MNPIEDVIIDVKTSCTRDEAVAKLLGWSRGNYFQRLVKVSTHGIDEVDLSKVSSFDGYVNNQLSHLHEKARSELIEALENDSAYDEIQKLEQRVIDCRALIDRAAGYFSDIDDELSNNPSKLRIDRIQFETERTFCITIRSLDEWAQNKYGFSVLQSDWSEYRVPAAPQLNEVKSSIDENDKELSEKSWIGFNITLALAFKALSEKYKTRPELLDRDLNSTGVAKGSELKAGLDDIEVNKSYISNKLANMAAKVIDSDDFPDQSASTLRSRITNALSIFETKVRAIKAAAPK